MDGRGAACGRIDGTASGRATSVAVTRKQSIFPAVLALAAVMGSSCSSSSRTSTNGSGGASPGAGGRATGAGGHAGEGGGAGAPARATGSGGLGPAATDGAGGGGARGGGGAGGGQSPAGVGGAAAPLATVLDFIPLAISGDGTVVVGTPNDLGGGVVRWTAATGAQVIPGIAALGPTKFSADGTTIVAVRQGSTLIARIVGTTVTTFDLGTWRINVVGVSDDGMTFAGTVNVNADGEEGFRWTLDGGFARLGFLPGDVGSAVEAISPDGETLLGLSFDATGEKSRPFRWTKSEGMVEIAPLAANSLTLPFAVNDGGTALAYGYSGGTVDRDEISWAGPIPPIDTVVLAPGAPARTVTGCDATISEPVAIVANGTILLRCGSASAVLVSPTGDGRLLSVPPPPAGASASDQSDYFFWLSRDGAQVVGAYHLGPGPDFTKMILVWDGSSSSPSLALSRLRGTPGDVDLLNPDVAAVSADGSTLIGGTMYGPNWLLRLR